LRAAGRGEELTMSSMSDFFSGPAGERGLEGGPALELAGLWRQGQPPNLEAFLSRTGPLSAEQLADVLCVDQRERWLSGERPPVEGYVKLFRSLHPEEEDLAVDLLYGELRVRHQLGETPTPEEYTGRFPELGPQMRLQVSMHQALYPPDQAQMPHVPGYALGRVLGQGGMGVVYLAEQVRLKRPVALKMLHLSGPGAEEELARFRSEAEAIARLQHVNIVQVHEAGEHQGRPFLAMELVEGGSLAQRLADAPLPAAQSAKLIEALAGAVHHAHQRGVLHRDIKPANVLLLADGTPKLTDFGLARRLDVEVGVTPTGHVLGTPGYMAPEQARGSKEVGPAADVYALGAVLYECLTGKPPFKGATAYETVLQVIQDDPVPPRRLRPAVPRDLETVCLKCLEKAPGRRYPSAEELAADLRRFHEGRPVAARPLGPVGRSVRWARRRPAAAALVVLAVAAALAVVGRGLWLERQQVVRRQQAREAVVTALAEAETLRRDLRWAEGLSVLLRAEPRLADTESDDLRRRVEGEKKALREVEEQFHASRQRSRDVLDLMQRAGGLVGPARTGASVANADHGNVSFDLSPDGKHVVFSAADGDLYLLSLPTSRVSRLTQTADEESAPAFSPDGKTIVYAAGPKGGGAKSICTRSVDGKEQRRLTNVSGVSDHHPSYSPDGSQIVFARAHRQRDHSFGGKTWDQWDVCVMGSDGRNLRRVTRESYFLLDAPRFTRGGREIVYSATVHRGDDLVSTAFAVDAAGGKQPGRFFGAPSPGQFAAWASQVTPAPDGERFVIVSDRARPFHYDLLVVDRGGTTARSLGVTTVSRYNQRPVVSRDSKSVLFLASSAWTAAHRPIYDLWRVDLAGGQARRVADSGLFTAPLHWKPRPEPK
jgi:serine/threonine-protein kinase